MAKAQPSSREKGALSLGSVIFGSCHALPRGTCLLVCHGPVSLARFDPCSWSTSQEARRKRSPWTGITDEGQSRLVRINILPRGGGLRVPWV